MNLLVINGPNLNMLGSREPEVYGTQTYEDLLDYIEAFAQEYQVTVDVIQSNSEGEIIDAIHGSVGGYDGIVLNPGAYTHYSYAIFDALQGAEIPAIEVHLSNINNREDFRKISVIAPACVGQISGLGFHSYSAALRYFIEMAQGDRGLWI
ncbi:MAG: type II 3-dehydroquinate dehydratase [Peptococcaceae bacterium]|nr:type II 3-dehydroquinate dehydratase [Peptococcaceae bacterium]